MKQLLAFILIIGLFACSENKNDSSGKGEMKIQWIDNLTGDFSFTSKWSYPEGVYRNESGQLSCDGFCPPEIDVMKDSIGRIYDDSLAAFYKIVDTTHQTHSIQCEAWCYEWAGTDFMEARQKTNDTVECYTLTNAGTHCNLHFYLVNDICYPIIELNSITSAGRSTYPCTDGYIKIDQEQFKNGIIKAEFDMNFEHKEDPKQKMYWKGKIYSKIHGI